MFYTIYKIINKIDGKYYIGKHQTTNLNDGYMGSGVLLKRAIKKHGLENFIKEILFIFDNEQEMNNKEKELVIISEETYNLCEGGKGGFGYINSNNIQKNSFTKENRDILYNFFLEKRKNDIEFNKNFLEKNKKIREKSKLKIKEKYPEGVWKNKKHTEESKKKIGLANSIKQQGSNNSQFRTMWITNGVENKKIKKDLDIISDGWYKGRATKQF